MNAAPLIIVAIGVAVLLAAIAVKRHYAVSSAIAFATLIAALAVIPAAIHAASAMPALFTLTPLVLGFIALILAAAALILVIGHAYWQKSPLPAEEFPLLLLIGTLGACALAAAASFITLFLGLETMTLAMIGMIAYARGRAEAGEAALKYLVLSGMSSAFLLFGVGLIELGSGSLDLSTAMAAPQNPLLLAGLAMLVIGAGFKLSVVPFHVWVPDIYAGAPAPAAAFVAVIAKIAVLAILIRLQAAGAALPHGLATAISAAAILSMLIGNLLALLQSNFKRLLGYSSIAHLGYLLVAFAAAGLLARTAIIFYLVTYAITMTGAFGVIALLSSGAAPRDADNIADLRGMFWTRPALAAMLTFVLLSLAGIPPAIGFIAKMYIFAAGIHTNLWLLIATMVVSSVIGLFYYLNIIIVMAQRPNAAAAPRPLATAWPSRLAISGLGIVVVVFGVAPQPLIALLRNVFG